jgi:diketogulonate reductase-like aldo/keto reductase
MENEVRAGRVRHIGISHTHEVATLTRLLDFAEIKPTFVQNPTIAGPSKWDLNVRSVCTERGIVYQAYYLFHPENDWVYRHPSIRRLAENYSRTPQQVVVAFARQRGLLPLVGSQDQGHMAMALAAARHLRLTAAELDMIENLQPRDSPSSPLQPAEHVILQVLPSCYL